MNVDSVQFALGRVMRNAVFTIVIWGFEMRIRELAMDCQDGDEMGWNGIWDGIDGVDG